MAKNLIRSARTAETLPDGLHADGEGLYLAVSTNKAGETRRKWVFIYRTGAKRTELSLGPFPTVSLAAARERAEECRRLRVSGIDPLEDRRRREREAEAAAREAEAERAKAAIDTSFGAIADAYITEAIAPALRNPKHIKQWRVTLGTVPFDEKRVRSDKKSHAAYVKALGELRAKAIEAIDVSDVLAVLTPLWKTAPETASRVRGRIERVLDAARARGLRKTDNPARWRGHLDHLLPARQRLTRGHHAALPYAQVPAFMSALMAKDDISSRLLAFIVLLACRTGEARGAEYREFDLNREIWTIPANRMKAGREHRVPLTPPVLKILEAVQPLRRSNAPDALIFPGSGGKALSVMTPTMALRRLAQSWKGEGSAPWAGVTVHGFRSAFRDFAGEETSFPREIAEAALAHVVGDATERAYRRGDALERRRELMAAWAGFAMSGAGDGKVIQMASRGRRG